MEENSNSKVPVDWDVKLINKAAFLSELRLHDTTTARDILSSIRASVERFKSDFPALHRQCVLQKCEGLLAIRDEDSDDIEDDLNFKYEPSDKFAIIIKRSTSPIPEATMRHTSRLAKIFTMTPVVQGQETRKMQTITRADGQTAASNVTSAKKIKLEVGVASRVPPVETAKLLPVCLPDGTKVHVPDHCTKSFTAFFKQKIRFVSGTRQVRSVGPLTQISSKTLPPFAEIQNNSL